LCAVRASSFVYRLLQRYQNVKKELENQQNIERAKLDKQLGGAAGKTGGAGAGRSVMMNQSRIGAGGASRQSQRQGARAYQ
jgi:hypothetical protein